MTAPTYTAFFISAPNAAGTFFQLKGSATKIVRVRRVSFTPIATGYQADALFSASISATASTSGSPSPVPAGPLDSTNPAATAVATAYAAPTVGSPVTVAYATRVLIGDPTAGIQATLVEWVGAAEAQCPTLRNDKEFFDLISQLGTYTGANVLGVVEWTEE